MQRVVNDVISTGADRPPIRAQGIVFPTNSPDGSSIFRSKAQSLSVQDGRKKLNFAQIRSAFAPSIQDERGRGL